MTSALPRPRYGLRAGWILCGVLALLGGWQVSMFTVEDRAVAATSSRFMSGNRTPARKVLAGQAVLTKELRAFSPRELKNRPFLRHTAIHIWRARAGECGEGTRLIINMLRHQDIPARRVLLYGHGDDTDHVGFEYFDGTRWVYEGAYNTPAGEVAHARRHPAPIARHFATGNNPLTDAYADYSYINIDRLPTPWPIHRPLPQWLTVVLENPPLMVGLLMWAGALVLAGLLMGVGLLRQNGRPGQWSVAPSPRGNTPGPVAKGEKKFHEPLKKAVFLLHSAKTRFTHRPKEAPSCNT